VFDAADPPSVGIDSRLGCSGRRDEGPPPSVVFEEKILLVVVPAAANHAEKIRQRRGEPTAISGRGFFRGPVSVGEAPDERREKKKKLGEREDP